MSRQLRRGAFDLYRNYGRNGYIGELLSQLQHALQAARHALIRLQPDYTRGRILRETFCDMVLAAFFHDVGHLVRFIRPGDLEIIQRNGVDLGVMDHERVGAEYLRSRGFSELVCELVEGHVRTKRYLASVDENYYNNLSNASKRTLETQGGLMSEQERMDFEDEPYFDYHILLREFDDAAKISDPEYIQDIERSFPLSYFESFILD